MNPNNPHPLPARPSFTPTIPVQSRPIHQNTYNVVRPQAQSYYPVYPQHPNYYAQTNVNPSGGYQPNYGAYPPFFAPPPSVASYGQSLFRPTATPEGYSYSSHYLNAESHDISSLASSSTGSTVPQPPPKRQRTALGLSSTLTAEGVKPWRNCSHPGCKYTGPGEQVEIHEGDRHLIFPAGYKVERSEEEEKFASHKGPLPPIQGTTIRLETDEDIARWIADRKAKWPSSKRVAEKEEERQAAIARGDIPARGRGRGRGRGGFSRAPDPAMLAEDWGREPREQQEPSEQSHRDGGGRRGGDRGRGRGRGRGTGRPERPTRDMDIEPAPLASSTVEERTVTTSTENVSGLGLGGYETSSGSDSDGAVTHHLKAILSDSDSDSSSDSDSELDSETEAVKGAEADAVAPVTAKPTTALDSRPLCRFFARTGKCKHGDKCKFSHGVQVPDSGAGIETSSRPVHKAPPAPRQPVPKRQNPFQRPSMLGALLANPIENTLSQLAQTTRFLVANNFLKDVELVPGQAEEQARERTKVVLMQTNESAAKAIPVTNVDDDDDDDGR